MFNSAIGLLPERMLRTGPRLVSVVLASLIAAELTQAVLLFVHPPSTPANADPHRELRVHGARPGVDISEIAAAHLFGVLDVDPDVQDPRPTAARLVLAGTIATEDPNHGVAIISGEDAPSKVYSVGQNVAGAQLHAVYLDHVLLSRNGTLETLTLPKLLTGGKQPAKQPSERRQAPPPAENDLAQGVPRGISEVVRVAPSSSAGIRGFRIVGANNPPAFRASGLRPGDLMTAINGVSLQDPQAAQRSFNEAQSGHAVVSIMRGVHPMNIDVDFGQ